MEIPKTPPLVVNYCSGNRHQLTTTEATTAKPNDMVENVEAPIKVEASVKAEASVKVEASSFNSGVWKLCENEVDTTNFFSIRETWKDKDELNPMLELVCEQSGEHKVPKKKVKHEATESRKYGCLFKVHGYMVVDENAWKSAILNGVQNNAMVPYLEGATYCRKINGGRQEDCI
ncbi:hypothetical protein MTR_5g060510 [Medicago truncatula]|uniref:Uncharacterized protein n=1 Tax=Medicago truncatula TaxID=3880 RepID=G7K9X3_MEDTR|nr:hypothetical protein MTR_5g060510 [Medicago truncatula]